MAQTVYAGQLGAGLGLQGASETIADSMAIQNDNALVKAKLSQMASTEEAVELENQIRRDERERANQEASIEGLILRQALDPEGAAGQLQEQGPDAFAQQFKGANAGQVEKLDQVLKLGRFVREQQEAQAALGKALNLASMVAMTDAHASPGYAEGLADLSARLQAYDPLNPEAETPQELAAEYRSLKEQDFIFRSVVSDRERAGTSFDTTFGTGEEYAALREMYLDHDTREDAANQAYALKYPKAAAKAKAQAQDEVASKVRIDLAQDFTRLAQGLGWEPGTEEWDKGQEAFYESMRDALGEEVVPKPPKQVAREQKEAWEDSQLKLLRAAGLSLEEGVKAVELGEEAVQRALAAAAEKDAKKRAEAAAKAKKQAPKPKKDAPDEKKDGRFIHPGKRSQAWSPPEDE